MAIVEEALNRAVDAHYAFCSDCTAHRACEYADAAARLVEACERMTVTLAEYLGCLPREVNALGSTKQLPGCGAEVAAAIRQEFAAIRERAKRRR